MITKERRTISVCCSLCASYNVFSRMKTAAVVCLCYFALPRRGKEETFLGGEERKGGAIRVEGKLQSKVQRAEGELEGKLQNKVQSKVQREIRDARLVFVLCLLIK